LEGPNVTFHFKTRHAIWHGLKALDLPPGKTVLVPSYTCGVELDAILKAGVEVKFYRVDRSARLDLDHLRQLVDGRTGAVFVTHYFGFPQPDLPALVALCTEQRLWLIEDCAHSLYSTYAGRYLGTFGDLGVFSLGKSLPVPDGGALRLNNPSLTARSGAVPPPLGPCLNGVLSSIGAYLRVNCGAAGAAAGRWGIAAPAALARRLWGAAGPAADGPAPHMTFDVRTADWGASAVSRYILSRIDHHHVFQRRRANYQFLVSELESVPALRPLHSTIPEGVCPLCVPVLVDDPLSLHEHLRRRGIHTDLFWSTFHERFPRDDFPDAVALKTHLVALPVHQDSNVRASRYLVEEIVQWARAGS
jgi:dTDP-4-amino-4,6-dideoxygalactose transaminase